MADRVIREAYLAIREARKLLSRNTIRCAMPRQDAYSSFWDGDRQTEEPTYPPDQKWYHRSDHDLPAGTILTPGGGKSKWEQAYKDRGEPVNDQDWVWMTSPEQTDFSEDTGDDFGKHLYEIQPLDEGPYPWNNLPFEHVAPRARIIRKVDPRAAWSEFSRTFKKNASKSLSSNTIRCAMPMMYHHTLPENAEAILRERRFNPPDPVDDFSYFSDQPDGAGTGYGPTRIDVDVPYEDWRKNFEIDPYDVGATPEGETHWRARSKSIRPEWIFPPNRLSRNTIRCASITVPVGSQWLHCTPSYKIVDAVQKAGVPVHLSTHDHEPVSADSLLNILGLGAFQGDPVTVHCDDENVAAAIAKIIETNHDLNRQ